VLVFFENKYQLMFGLLTGTLYSLFRLSSTANWLSRILVESNSSFSAGRSTVYFIVNQVILIVYLVVAIKFDLWFFAGAVCGITSVPVIIMVFGILQAFGITKSFFD
jgi:hypothetical protein